MDKMQNEILIYEALTKEDIEETKSLFIEYAKSLNFDLCFQGFDEEINTLPGKYSPPDGVIYLAKYSDKIAGCIALRKLEDGICEMKRLYVKPEYRGYKIGKLLCVTLINKSRLMGYKKMRLDTISHVMADAIRLYKSYGFYEIQAYNYNPEKGVIYMEMKL